MKGAMPRFEVVPLTEVPRKSKKLALKGNDGPDGARALRDRASQVTAPTLSVVDEGSSMPCEEKARLAKDYDAATSRFSEAVKELHRNMGTSPKEEYDRLARVSDQARMSSEQARLALEQHIATHRC
jgi:hypothetical protein